MIKVGVTGAIGSGKTTLCKELERLGAPVFYADEEAKKLMVTSPDVRGRLKKTFGKAAYHDDGSLNKEFLIEEAFRKNRVDELNRIVHPAVGKAFKKFCEQAKQNGKKIAVKEAALLLNNGRPEDLDVVVIVISDLKMRVQRVTGRDGTSKEKVLERNRKQPDFEKLTHLADVVVENNGTLDQLQEKAKNLYQTIIRQHE